MSERVSETKWGGRHTTMRFVESRTLIFVLCICSLILVVRGAQISWRPASNRVGHVRIRKHRRVQPDFCVRVAPSPYDPHLNFNMHECTCSSRCPHLSKNHTHTHLVVVQVTSLWTRCVSTRSTPTAPPSTTALSHKSWRCGSAGHMTGWPRVPPQDCLSSSGRTTGCARGQIFSTSLTFLRHRECERERACSWTSPSWRPSRRQLAD